MVIFATDLGHWQPLRKTAVPVQGQATNTIVTQPTLWIPNANDTKEGINQPSRLDTAMAKKRNLTKGLTHGTKFFDFDTCHSLAVFSVV